MDDDPRILVLLGTFNGARFIQEQIQSIQRQSVCNWTLLVRDDDSQDDTTEIVMNLARTDERIRCVRDANGRLGIVGNFGQLMRLAHEESPGYIFFSDQDDVWLPNKIAEEMDCLKALESQYGRDTPLLVYSDLEVVTENLRRLHPSYMRYQKLAHESHEPLRVLLTQNFVTGCATLVNRPLLELAVPVPSEVIIHDWWLALCAAACGKIGFLPHATVRYRQHVANQIGAEGFLEMVNPLSAGSRQRLAKGEYYFLGALRQAALLSERISSRGIPCSPTAKSLLNRFAACARESRLRRLWSVSRLGLRRQGVMRALLLYWRLLVSPRVTNAGERGEHVPSRVGES
jgi:glycosyltransferase involved in cell wall biosynthesis